jgi:hypothetical protein
MNVDDLLKLNTNTSLNSFNSREKNLCLVFPTRSSSTLTILVRKLFGLFDVTIMSMLRLTNIFTTATSRPSVLMTMVKTQLLQPSFNLMVMTVSRNVMDDISDLFNLTNITPIPPMKVSTSIRSPMRPKTTNLPVRSTCRVSTTHIFNSRLLQV